MSRHHLNRICQLTCPMILALISSQALAQSIPASWKVAGDAESHRPEITKAVAVKMAKLQIDDSDTQKSARQWVLSQVDGNPSASFLDVYADVVDNALENIVNPKKASTTQPISLRIRLNAAIINAKVAERALNARQCKVTGIFLRDTNEAIVLWGMQAAKYELPAQLAQEKIMRGVDLLKAVLDAVRAHPQNGEIAEEAYTALTFDKTDNSLKDTSNQTIQELIPQIIELLSFRASLFTDTAPPPSLYAETPAITFFARIKVRPLETPVQRQKAILVLYSYLVGSGKLLPDANADVKYWLLDCIHHVARAFQVIEDKDAGIMAAAKQVELISGDTKTEVIQQRLDDLKTAIDGSAAGPHVASH